MVINKMITDEWINYTLNEKIIEQPKFDNVINSIEKLDANKYTLITLCGKDEMHMAIGGGNGKYIVYITFDNLSFWNLIDSNNDGKKIMLNVGGQEGDYPSNYINPKENVVKAAECFFYTGRIDNSLNWEKK